MHRLLAMAMAMTMAAAALASTACKKKKEEGGGEAQPAAATPAPAAALTLDEVQKHLPDTLAGLPRQLVSPEPEIPQVSAYYQDGGNTRSGHVVYTILKDPAKTASYYQNRFPERTEIGGRPAYARVWQPKSAPETAEGCLVVGQAIGVCVDIAPGTIADLAPLFEALPLAEIEKRATGN